MTKVQNNFETNSSSCHSLCIANTDTPFEDLATLGYKDEDGVFYVTGETTFGWQVSLYNDAGSKANYLRIDNEHDKEFVDRLRSIIASNIGGDKVVFEGVDCAKKYDAYIDHQSQGTSFPVTQLSDEEIWKFIMNPDCSFQTDNDNR